MSGTHSHAWPAWLMMGKVSQTSSPLLHFQTTTRGVGFSVFNQCLIYQHCVITAAFCEPQGYGRDCERYPYMGWKLYLVARMKVGWPDVLLQGCQVQIICDALLGFEWRTHTSVFGVDRKVKIARLPSWWFGYCLTDINWSLTRDFHIYNTLICV